MIQDIVIALGILIVIGSSLSILPAFLRRFHIRFSNYTMRNLTHVISFLLIAFAIHFVKDKWVITSAGSVAALSLIGAVELNLMPDVMHGSRIRDYGFIGSALGFVAVIVLFFPYKAVISAALLIVGLADPLASAVGRSLGRHKITAWGCTRSLEGSIAFASMTFAVSLVFFYVTGNVTFNEIGISLFVAFTTAILELIVPSAMDNVLIAVWAGFLLFLIQIKGNQFSSNWLIAIFVSAVSAPLIYRLKWMDEAGTAGSMFVATVLIALGGWKWLLSIFVFFFSTSILTKFRQAERSAKEPRRIQQAFVNGLIPSIPVFGYAVNGKTVWFFLYMGAVAVANADTWATEIGRFSRVQPISLKTFRSVETGTSGAITLLGIFASVFGGALIGAAAALVSPSKWRPYLFLTGTIVGLLGSFLDSMIGAWFQSKYWCNVCKKAVEEPKHCGGSCHRFSGLRRINNDVVNAIANIGGMFMAFMLYNILP